MTRRGSIAYYCAAVVCGALFAAASGLILEGRGVWRVTDFFLVYFLALAFGWFSLILFAFLLRRTARLLHLRNAWSWLLAGAILAPAFVWTLDAIWKAWFDDFLSARSAWFWIMFAGGGMGARAFVGDSLRLTLAAATAGIATSFILQRIHHAFEERE